jgi:hypothetical protein
MLGLEEPEKNEAGSKSSNPLGPGGSDKSETPPLAEIH